MFQTDYVFFIKLFHILEIKIYSFFLNIKNK